MTLILSPYAIMRAKVNDWLRVERLGFETLQGKIFHNTELQRDNLLGSLLGLWIKGRWSVLSFTVCVIVLQCQDQNINVSSYKT